MQKWIKGFSTLSLERELLNLLGTGRDALIAGRYYGFDGRGGGTHRAVGNEFGLSHQRVGQIATLASKRLSADRPHAPTLDRTIKFVANSMPAQAAEIEAQLQPQGLTSGAFRLEYIIKAADLLGRTLPFSITEVQGERFVHAKGLRLLDRVVSVGRRAIGERGLGTIAYVAAELHNVESGLSERKLIEVVLACQKGFRWLDQSKGWFWFSDVHANRLLNRIRKILSVAKSISISELRAGVLRDYRMQGFSLPSRLLLEFCRQVSGLRVYDTVINAEPKVNPDEILGQAERDIARILSDRGGVLSRPELESLCLGMGMNRRTFYQYLSYSPIISRRPIGSYGLIGSRVSRMVESGASRIAQGS
jgi:hypothetical protein